MHAEAIEEVAWIVVSLDNLDWSAQLCRSLGKAGSPVQTGICTGVAVSHAGLVAGALEKMLSRFTTPLLCW